MSCGKPCECPSYREHCLSVGFSASAMPTRKENADVAWKEERERTLNKDMPAYKRLRKEGLQPRHILGSAECETRATDRIEVEHETVYGKKNLSVVNEINSALTEAGAA